MNLDLMQLLAPEYLAKVDQKLCPVCNQPINGFRDAQSEREYNISGLCQSCQDDMFTEPEYS